MVNCGVDLVSDLLVDAPDSNRPVAHGDFGLRTSTAADRDFLRDVYFSTRIDEFLRAGLEIEEVKTLLVKQFSMQDEYYRRHYPQAHFDVIVRGQTDVGRLYHDWSGADVSVIDIALLPQHRGGGIGTRLMRAMVAEAARRGMAMRLFVEFDNPVRGLYRRLGFVQSGENGLYELMRREAAPFDDEGKTPRIAGLGGETG
jgi:ribosomal protein S18 acetylase RimI-like enzyme